MNFFNKLRAKFHGVPYRINDFFYNYVIMEENARQCRHTCTLGRRLYKEMR